MIVVHVFRVMSFQSACAATTALRGTPKPKALSPSPVIGPACAATQASQHPVCCAVHV
jgi:hypothetical protein